MTILEIETEKIFKYLIHLKITIINPILVNANTHTHSLFKKKTKINY